MTAEDMPQSKRNSLAKQLGDVIRDLQAVQRDLQSGKPMKVRDDLVRLESAHVTIGRVGGDITRW